MFISCVLLAATFAAPVAPVSDLTTATQALVEALNDAQRADTLYPFDAGERWDWHYVPRARPGLSFRDLEEAQYPLILDLLRAGLSESGYETVETIRALEVVLRKIEGPNATHRDPLDYHVSIFGTPTRDGTWALRYEGHHVSLHWTVVDGKAMATTPQFLGANPGEVAHGPLEGTRALGELEDLGRELISALRADQQPMAIVRGDAPRDIVTGTDRDAKIPDQIGISFTELSEPQQAMLMGLIEAHAQIQRPEIAAQRLARIRRAGMDAVKFAWMGSTRAGEPHYYRVQGKTFIIEYDNVQNGAKHPHTVWRDFHGDFGKDLLKEHYARHQH